MNTEIHNALETLKKGGIILYPTETVWALGCDAAHPDAIDRLYALKKRSQSDPFLCLVHDFKMLNEFVEEIPEVAYDILKYAERPTTVIYDNPIRISENLIGLDNTLGYRVTKDEFCTKLLRKLRRPIVSTSAHFKGQKAPKNFKEISQEVLDSVDYIVNLNKNKNCQKPSAIIKLSNDGRVKIIRK